MNDLNEIDSQIQNVDKQIIDLISLRVAMAIERDSFLPPEQKNTEKIKKRKSKGKKDNQRTPEKEAIYLLGNYGRKKNLPPSLIRKVWRGINHHTEKIIQKNRNKQMNDQDLDK
jgi:chorismate mutase